MPAGLLKEERSLRAQDFVFFLALIGDKTTDARTKIMAPALLDRLDHGLHTPEATHPRLAGA
jgi:hypothetical protein